MNLDQTLVDAAINFIKTRFPPDKDWVGASAMYTHTGKILVNTSPIMPNASTEVCHETGAICEAFKIN